MRDATHVDGVTWDFEQNIRNEEDLEGNIEFIANQVQLFEDAQHPDIAQIDAVHETKHEDDP